MKIRSQIQAESHSFVCHDSCDNDFAIVLELLWDGIKVCIKSIHNLVLLLSLLIDVQ